MSEFVEFTISSPERFAALQRVFAELKRDKDAEDWRSTEELLEYFDEDSRRHFYWPPADLRQQRLDDLQNRVIFEVPTENSTNLTWDFDSLVDSFVTGEYKLISCEILQGNIARLDFYSHSYPYGGVGCMVALIEAFEGVVTGIDDGTGFISISQPKI